MGLVGLGDELGETCFSSPWDGLLGWRVTSPVTVKREGSDSVSCSEFAVGGGGTVSDLVLRYCQ